MEKATLNRIKMVRNHRKKYLLDKVLIKFFPQVFSRWCDRHLGYAHEGLVINNKQLHSLDYQMKTDLKRPGFPKL